MNLSNKVYNELKTHARSDTYKRARVKDKEEISTVMQAMDKSTKLLVYKLMNRGVLESVNGIIATGKESVVIYARGSPDCEDERIKMNSEVVIKAFKTSLDEYKTRGKYLRDDHRYRDCLSRLNPRTLIASWAQKELQNLQRLKNAGIPSPEPLFLRNHVLILSLVGQNGIPAPKLKDVSLSLAEWELAYAQVVELMKTMYHTAELIHCDLSEYNILYAEGQCYFIDVSQALLKNTRLAHDYLFRDCRNISKFFDKKKVHAVMSPAEMFRAVSGLNFDPTSFDFETRIQDFEKDEESLALGVSEKEDMFEELWDLMGEEEEEEGDDDE